MNTLRLCAYFFYLSGRRTAGVVRLHPFLSIWFVILFLGGVFILHLGFLIAISGAGLIPEIKPEDVLIILMVLFFIKSVAEGFHTLVDSNGVGFLLSQPITESELVYARMGASTLSHMVLIATGSGVLALFDSYYGFVVLSNTPPVAYIELILAAPFASVLGIGTSLEAGASTPLRRVRNMIYTTPFGISLLIVHLTGFGYLQVGVILFATLLGAVMLYLRHSVIYEVSVPQGLRVEKTLHLPAPFFWILNRTQKTLLSSAWVTFIRGRQMRVTLGVVATLFIFSLAIRFELNTLIAYTEHVSTLLASHFDLLSLIFIIYFGGMLLAGVPAMEGIILNRRSMWLYRSLPVSTEDLLIARARLLAPNMLILMFGVGIPASLIVGLTPVETAVLVVSSGILFLMGVGMGQILGGVFIKGVEEEYESSVLVLYTLLMSTLILFSALLMIAWFFFTIDWVLGVLVLVLIFDLSFLIPIAGIRISSRFIERFEGL